MKRGLFLLGLFFLGPLAAAAETYDSALAPYPALQASYGAEVEAVLAAVSKNAGAGAFSATVNWSVESAAALDLDRQNFGPLSLKTSPNWHVPRANGYWPQGTYNIVCAGSRFRMEKPQDEASPADWWQKDAEHIYSRAWSEDWPMSPVPKFLPLSVMK